ncbi:hypothetical protein CN213_16085 [Sinorhizobium meliloti]|uniref:hypothetical protein n=1 Tax=Rhizobium meliloti TaxID=382 RepID=UPI000FD9762D|nr:hypothetical protein [Sinorhizobium meliloti]RVH56265.1 hypothetical protein CN213_16085 [Sinorhizobium meliloti]
MKREPPIKCCQNCFAVQYAARKVCCSCGAPLGDPLKAWERHDDKLRSIMVEGIMYIANRPDRSSMWTIKDGSTLKIIAERLTTRDVTAYFRRKADKEASAAFARWRGGE